MSWLTLTESLIDAPMDKFPHDAGVHRLGRRLFRPTPGFRPLATPTRPERCASRSGRRSRYNGRATLVAIRRAGRHLAAARLAASPARRALSPSVRSIARHAYRPDADRKSVV